MSRILRAGLAVVLLAALALAVSQQPARAATSLEAEIVSWQIIGLDSNAPATSTPEIFLVQVQIRNTGAETATGVRATLTLTSPDCGGVPCITIVSSPTVGVGSIAAGGQADAFWTVRIAKTPAAFDTVTQVDVTVSADNAPAVTATQVPRSSPPCGVATPGNVLYVERLISQNRNNVLSYSVSPGVQLADGSWEVVQGTSFTVTVVASTATIYDEISVPATIDPAGIITPTSVSVVYEQGTPSDDDIYTLNAGGQVTAQYVYSASAIGTLTLAVLIYDCSGASFHYNTDYLVDVITIRVVQAPALVLTKSASPSPASPGETVTYTLTYQNVGGVTLTDVVISDTVDPALTDIVPLDNGAFDPATRTITWQVGTVPPGSTGTVSFRATVSDFAGGQTIRNLATATSAQLPPVSSPPFDLPILPTTPPTGSASELLAILAWALIGFGSVLSSRRLEGIRLT